MNTVRHIFTYIKVSIELRPSLVTCRVFSFGYQRSNVVTVVSVCMYTVLCHFVVVYCGWKFTRSRNLLVCLQRGTVGLSCVEMYVGKNKHSDFSFILSELSKTILY